VIEVIVVGEGQTEETFVDRVLAPALWDRQISVSTRLIRTSRRGRGGALSGQRVLKNLRNTLLERSDVYVTTFFDLYGLHADFPGFEEGRSIHDPIDRTIAIERRFAEMVIAEANCRADRFIPHIQPHEFEALLFSDVESLSGIRTEWKSCKRSLQEVRDAAPTPEHINDGPDSHPSARLAGTLRPGYEKVLHGPSAARVIGLECMRAECRHFDEWLRRLESLPPLTDGA